MNFIPKKSAFTMVELLVVLMIAAILGASLIPVLNNYLPSAQLSGSIRELTSALREAQEKAVTEQDQHLIRFVQMSNPPIYQLIKIHNSVEEQIREEQLSNRITLTLDPVVAQIVFSPDGGPSAATNITLAINGSQKKIDVSPAGFIKIE